ncbi:hypothetical protein [Ferruginibacter sp.]
MKHLITASVLLTCLITATCLTSCGKKDSTTSKPKEELAMGTWSINRVQIKIYYNGVFNKDSILPAKNLPKNFVQFDNNADFQYCFSSPTINSGTYVWKGADSLIATTPSTIYRWKMLTLTTELFTVVNTSTNNPAFPGAKVETYQTFVR